MSKPHQDDLISSAVVRTFDGDVGVSIRHRRQKDKRAVEVKFTDLGRECGNIFDWAKWRGTQAEHTGNHDTAMLRFKGVFPADAVIYGLWKAADQLFTAGRGLTVRELQLSVDHLSRLFCLKVPTFELVSLMKSGANFIRGSKIGVGDIQAAPLAARNLFREDINKPNFHCVVLEVCFDDTPAETRPYAIFAPSVDPDREEALARLSKHGARSENFYFDFDNERLVLEVALWQATELLRRSYAEKEENRNSDRVREIHSNIRRLTLMHDVASHNQEIEEAAFSDEGLSAKV